MWAGPVDLLNESLTFLELDLSESGEMSKIYISARVKSKGWMLL
jgi:hypothetical protein